MSCNNNPLGIALVGYGGMGGWHVETISKIPEVELKGIYDIDPARCDLAKSRSINVYNSLDEVIADASVSVVTVAVPNDIHRELCIKLMQGGKNVVCEKPVTLSSEDLEAMIKAAEDNNVIFTVHQNRRWDEDYLIVKKLYDENTLGDIFDIQSRVHGSRGIPSDWRNQKKYGGGMVLDWGVHLFDQMLMMTKGRKLLSIYAELTYITNAEVDDGFKVTALFEGDLAFHTEVGTSNFINLPRWYVQGKNGSAIIENWQNDGKIVMVSDWEKRDAVPVVTSAGLTKTMAPRTDETIKTYPLPRIKSDICDYYRNIARAVRGEETQLITHDELRRSMKFMELVFESAEKNIVIKDVEL